MGSIPEGLTPINISQDLTPLDVPKDLTPVNIPSGLTPYKGPEETKFTDYLKFTTVSDAMDLWKYESLPASAIAYASGNTKQKQAIEAQKFLDNNSDKVNTPKYREAEKIIKHYGYTLSDEPFNAGAIIETIKSNPKMFGAEMLNMMVADPYLLWPGFWGGWAVKAAQATKTGAKVVAAAPKLTNATLRTIGSTPTLAAYSSIHQLSEDGNLNAKRLATESAFGGAAIFAMSALFAGSTAKASGILGIKPEELGAAFDRAHIKHLGPEVAKPYLRGDTAFDPTTTVASALKSTLDTIDDAAIGFNPNKWSFIEGTNWKSRMASIKDIMAKDKNVTSKMSYGYLKEKGIFRNIKTDELHINRGVLEQQFKTDPFKKYFKDVDAYINYKAEVIRLKNNAGYKNRTKWNEENIKLEALKNHNNRSYASNKWKEAIHDELVPFVEQEYRNLKLAENTRFYHIRNLKSLKAPAMAGTIAGVASMIFNPNDDDAFWTAALIGSGGVTAWKTASTIMARNNSLKAGLKVSTTSTTDQMGTRLGEIKQSLPKGMKLEDIGIKDMPSFYTNAKIKKADLRKLGRAEEIELAKSMNMSGSLLDDYNVFVRNNSIDTFRIHELLKAKVPDKAGAEKLTAYLQGDKTVKLSKLQLEAANDIRRILDGMWKTLDGSELKYRFLESYLPQYWRPRITESDASIAAKLKDLITKTHKASSLKGSTMSEFEKFFPSYKAGVAAGLEPVTLDAIAITTQYMNSVTRAIAQRRLVSMMRQTKIPGRSDGKGGLAKLMYGVDDLPKTKIAEDYVRFYHPAFLDRKIDFTKLSKQQRDAISPWILREAEPVMRMLFDAREEGAILKAISNFNFLQKRFSVGYSFFHAGALLQSSVYMAMHPISAGKMFLSATGAGNIAPFKWFIPKWKDNTAYKMLMQDGNGDVLKAATRAGVEFSHPEDIGFNNFYQTWAGAKNYLDKHPSWISYLAKAGITNLVEKPFKYIDMVTWDRVFNAGKLYAWQTNVMKLLNNPKFSKAPLNEIYKQAAIVTNDGYGGLNWQQLYMSTNDPILKKMKEYAYRPSGRKWMQRVLFAPDWTTANFRIISRAFPGFNDNAMSRSLYQAYTIRASLIVGTGGAALQQMFAGTNIWDNKDPTKVDLGNGFSISLSKQLFEPLHWAHEPFSYAIAKQSSILKSTEQALFNKKFLTSPWPSPISKADILSLQRAYDYAGHYGMSFVPFSFRPIVEEIAEEGGISIQDALGEILRSLGGLTGYPIYPIGRGGI